MNLEITSIGSMRRKLGLTQTQLAKLSGVSQSLIAKIESGRIDPAYSKVKRIFEALENEMNRDKHGKTARQIMCHHVIGLSPADRLEKAIKIMKERNISQIPVMDGGLSIGSVSDSMLIGWMEKYGSGLGKVKVSEAMAEAFPILPEDADIASVSSLLKAYKAVLIGKNGAIKGIITKADLFKAVEKQ